MTGGRDPVPTGKRVLVLAQLDRFANGVKPVEIERFLIARGHSVDLVDTYYLSRASHLSGAARTKLPRPCGRGLGLYAAEGAFALLTRRGMGRRALSYPLLRTMFRLRRGILSAQLRPLGRYDLIICEQPFDAEVLRDAVGAVTLYDGPTPFADELRYEGRLTGHQHRKMRAWERDLLEGVDHLAFWWPSYARYACRYYGISGANLMRLDYGCTPSEVRASFAAPSRIAYLGSLSSKFIDLPLLSRLARSHPLLDVYGAPAPDPRLGLRYRGPATPDVLRHYQAGLITCTDDPLRRHGFSAKHLQYLAYGLPVLVPAWRRDGEVPPGTLHYDEGSFSAVVAGLADPKRWQEVSDAAYAAAQVLRWERTLRPLEALLAGIATGREAVREAGGAAAPAPDSAGPVARREGRGGR